MASLGQWVTRTIDSWEWVTIASQGSWVIQDTKGELWELKRLSVIWLTMQVHMINKKWNCTVVTFRGASICDLKSDAFVLIISPCHKISNHLFCMRFQHQWPTSALCEPMQSGSESFMLQVGSFSAGSLLEKKSVTTCDDVQFSSYFDLFIYHMYFYSWSQDWWPFTFSHDSPRVILYFLTWLIVP